MSKSIATIRIQEVTKRMELALGILQKEKGMPVGRARAIAKTASSIIKAVKIEAMQSAAKQEKQ